MQLPDSAEPPVLLIAAGLFYWQNYRFLRAYLGADSVPLIPVNHLND